MQMKKKQLGQGMTEYIIIVALIAVAAIGVYRLFGDTVRNQTAGMAMELAGEDGTQARNTAKNKAKSAESNAQSSRNLSHYTGNN